MKERSKQQIEWALDFFLSLGNKRAMKSESEKWKTAIFLLHQNQRYKIFSRTHLQNMYSKCLPNGYKLWLEQNTVPTTIPNGRRESCFKFQKYPKMIYKHFYNFVFLLIVKYFFVELFLRILQTWWHVVKYTLVKFNLTRRINLKILKFKI